MRATSVRAGDDTQPAPEVLFRVNAVAAVLTCVCDLWVQYGVAGGNGGSGW